MYPILISLGDKAITSFGLFLVLSLIVSLFVIWRMARIYDLDGEKVFDVFFLTLIVGFLFARIYFVLLHIDQFNSLSKLVLINKYPGLSFWGGFLGGLLTLYLYGKRFKVSFYFLADFAISGLFIAIGISSIGCLLGSCQYGFPSNLPFAVPQVGLVDRRFPLQIIEATLYFLAFIMSWRSAVRYHLPGSVAAKGLIFLGLSKFILEFFRGDRTNLPSLNFSDGYVLSASIFLLGFIGLYITEKRSLVTDLKSFYLIFSNENRRKIAVLKFKRECYNLKVNSRVALSRWRKRLFKGINVKSNPTKF